VSRITNLRHEFVVNAPEQLEPGVLYVSLRYNTALHLCCCGCGAEVVTPISPTDWQLVYNGVGVSLYPSVGNWQFACRSHYWVRYGRVEWSYQMTQADIDAGRRRDAALKAMYFEGRGQDDSATQSDGHGGQLEDDKS
jgi:Family of unknown function (DUF6527)